MKENDESDKAESKIKLYLKNVQFCQLYLQLDAYRDPNKSTFDFRCFFLLLWVNTK